MGFTTEEPFFSAERDTASRSRHKKTRSSISRDESKERKPSSSSSPSASTSQPGLGLFPSASNTDAAHDPLAGLSSLFANPALLAAAQQHASGRFNQFMFSWPPIASTNNGSGHHAANFDSLLSGFPVDPFLVPPAAVAPFGPPFGAAPQSSLPPLTVRGDEDAAPRTPTSSNSGGIFAIDPALALAPLPAAAPLPVVPTAAKRQKTSAGAAAIGTSTHTTAAKKKPAPTPTTTTTTPTTEVPRATASPESKPPPAHAPAPRPMTPVTAAEDKRRRNTAASARFRAKKKEREVAMERKARDLDDRVLELERECESLRKENGWLKGLVVGATTGDGADLAGFGDMFSAFKAAAAPSVLAAAPGTASNEERIGSKRKRTTA